MNNKLIFSAYTERGDVKAENQDSILAKNATINDKAVGLFIVADGCGGLANGAKISNLITSEFGRLWDSEIADLSKKKSTEIIHFFESTINYINLLALDFSERTGEKCGSTMSLLFIAGTDYYIFHVGDSRIYKIKHKIKLLTEDQTVVADMLRRKEISMEAAKVHKQRHILNMCIGYFRNLNIYIRYGRIRRGDIFVLCCDGIYKCINEKIICKMSKKKRNFENAAVRLRSVIEQGKARDNVSIVIVKNKLRWF